MRSLTISAVLLCTILTQNVAAEDCAVPCAWSAVVSSPTTTDLYPAGNTKEECERFVAQARPAQPAGSDITIACVDQSSVNGWFYKNVLDPRPSK
jgi:hypothetical protein